MAKPPKNPQDDFDALYYYHKYQIATPNVNLFDGRHFDTIIADDLVEKPLTAREAFSKIPTLAGQICGDLVIWGHVIKPRNTVYSHRLWLECSCGWKSDDLFMNNPNNQFLGPMITKIVMKHIPKAEFEEIEYTTVQREWIEDLPRDTSRDFLQFLEMSGAILHYVVNTREYIIVDDKMDDEAVAKLAEFLEGHPTGVKKLRVLKK